MNENEFVDRLRKIPLHHEQYRVRGLNDDFILRTIKRYNPPPREIEARIYTDDPLIRLINSYDLSDTEIGMVCFDEEVTEIGDYFFIGRFEVEPLCISKATKEVVMLSDETGMESLRCARSSDAFLDSLIVAGIFLEKRIIDAKLIENEEIACSMAEHCAERAGGARYLDFYKILLGCDS